MEKQQLIECIENSNFENIVKAEITYFNNEGQEITGVIIDCKKI